MNLTKKHSNTQDVDQNKYIARYHLQIGYNNGESQNYLLVKPDIIAQ